MERSITGGFITEFQSLLNLAMDGGRGKAGFCSNFPHGLVLGLEVNKLLEVFGFSEGILLAKMIGLAFLGVVEEESDVVHEDVADTAVFGCSGRHQPLLSRLPTVFVNYTPFPAAWGDIVTPTEKIC